MPDENWTAMGKPRPWPELDTNATQEGPVDGPDGKACPPEPATAAPNLAKSALEGPSARFADGFEPDAAWMN